MTTYALILGHGPGWDPTRGIREQDQWNEHAAFMDGLVDSGFVVVGGPLDDGSQTLHLVEAPSEIAVRQRMARDPWAVTGQLRIDAIHRWSLWLDGRQVNTR